MNDVIRSIGDMIGYHGMYENVTGLNKHFFGISCYTNGMGY